MATTVVSNAEQEVIAFLLRSPSLREIADFRLSPEANDRIDALLEANHTNSMTDADRDEMERYLHFEHFIRMLKIQAHAQLAQQASFARPSRAGGGAGRARA